MMTTNPAILTGMSHEMRTHMNTVVAFSYLLKDSGCNDAEREEYSSNILKACEQMITMFDSFLDSSIIDSGETMVDRKVCRYDNMLDELLSEFRDELSKDERNELQLVSEIQYSSSLEILIDKNKICRILRSLFHNSLKNTRAGYIKIGYFMRNENVNFYIIDSGLGYFKSKEFITSSETNLSLHNHNDAYSAVNILLARKLISMLGGNVSVECNGMTGSGIYFSIPVKIVTTSDLKLNYFLNTMIAI